MLRSERDYMLRMIAAAAAAIARLRGRLAEGEPPTRIVQEARAAQGELLGRDAAILRALDPASAAQLIADREFLKNWAELMRVEAEALRAAGQADEAAELIARASKVHPADRN